MGTENGGTATARPGPSAAQLSTANNSDNTDEITRGPLTAPPPKPRSKPTGSKNKNASRPTKKKVRAVPLASAAAPSAAPGDPQSPPPAPSAAAAPNGNTPATAPRAPPVEVVPEPIAANGTRARGLTTVPRSMDEYRMACLRLEKVRHEKMYESEKRRLYTERSIERAYEWELRGADESYALGLKVIMSRMLQENAAKTRRVEEMRFGIIPSVEEDPNYGYLSRRHEMSLRNRNPGHGNGGNSVVDDEGNVIPNDDDQSRAIRRARKADSRAATAAVARAHSRNGGSKHDDHAQHKVKLHLALDDAAVASDLAKIKGGKRARDGEAGDVRRPKKRK